MSKFKAWHADDKDCEEGAREYLAGDAEDAAEACASDLFDDEPYEKASVIVLDLSTGERTSYTVHVDYTPNFYLASDVVSFGCSETK